MQELLDKLGWSQGYYARLIGVTNQTVYRWCKGKPDSVAMTLLSVYWNSLGRPDLRSKDNGISKDRDNEES